MNKHDPVLAKEAIYYLHVNKNKKYIDATLGFGGHTIEILKNGGKVLGIDTDEKMLRLAKQKIKSPNFKPIHGNFRNIGSLAKNNNFEKVDGILFDLGISSIHLDSDTRGFSFRKPSQKLDMRLNPKTQGVTAADLLNSLSQNDLFKLFRLTMSYKLAKNLSEKIFEQRKNKKFENVSDFQFFPEDKAFLALRIAVNSELETIKEALPKAFSLLNKNGRLVCLSFHSGEDALVKSFFKSLSQKGKAQILVKKGITPSQDEINSNPRARSARLRVIEKV